MIISQQNIKMGTICTSCKKSSIKLAPTVGKLIDQSDINTNTRLTSNFYSGI
jgi:hypothetical protein